MNAQPQQIPELSIGYLVGSDDREDMLGRLDQAFRVAVDFVNGQALMEGYKSQKIEHLEGLYKDLREELRGADASDQQTVENFRKRGFVGAADRVEFNESDLQIAEIFLDKSQDVCEKNDQEWQTHVDMGGTLPLDDMQKARIRRFLTEEYAVYGEGMLAKKFGNVDPESLKIFVEGMKPFIKAQAETMSQAEYDVLRDENGNFSIDMDNP